MNTLHHAADEATQLMDCAAIYAIASSGFEENHGFSSVVGHLKQQLAAVGGSDFA